MNNIDLTNVYSLSLKIFTILKSEYAIYLDNDKLNFLKDLDVFKFYKIIDNIDVPNIYYLGDKYFINSKFDFKLLEKLVPFLCFSSLISNLNPLKIGLIEKELLYLKDKYNLQIETIYDKELEIANLLSDTILKDVSYKVLFKESDSDIVNYLTEECGSRIGLLYLNISSKMKELRSIENYFSINSDIDYTNVLDYLYEYISHKAK